LLVRVAEGHKKPPKNSTTVIARRYRKPRRLPKGNVATDRGGYHKVSGSPDNLLVRVAEGHKKPPKNSTTVIDRRYRKPPR
jgi:hypothetical protein